MGCQPQDPSLQSSTCRPGCPVPPLPCPADTASVGPPQGPRLSSSCPQPWVHSSATPLPGSESVHRAQPVCCGAPQTVVTPACDSSVSPQADLYHQAHSDALAQQRSYYQNYHYCQQQPQQDVVQGTNTYHPHTEQLEQPLHSSDSQPSPRGPPQSHSAGLCQLAPQPHCFTSQRLQQHPALSRAATTHEQLIGHSLGVDGTQCQPSSRYPESVERPSPTAHLYRSADEASSSRHQIHRPADNSSRQLPGRRTTEASYPHSVPESRAPHTASFASPTQGQHAQAAGVGERSPSAERRAQCFLGPATRTAPQQGFPPHPPHSTGPVTMLDKKPILQVMTADHSPVSPGGGADSPHFIFPDVHLSTSSSTSSCLACEGHTSPFTLPFKREVRWEGGCSLQPKEREAVAMQQVPQERRRVLSGDTDRSAVDSETGSSDLEENSSSSREQSPFSGMAESLSLRSPSQHPHSPLPRKILQRQAVVMASDSEEQGEEHEGGHGTPFSSSTQIDSEFHPSKFKKRLHERYLLSLQDSSETCTVKEEAVDGDGYELGSQQDFKHLVQAEILQDDEQPMTVRNRSDSPHFSGNTIPKIPCRSSSDTDIVHMDSTEMGANSGDEGDVFMEPTTSMPAKHKPTSLHQREPLNLSRGPYFPSMLSNPQVDTEHLNTGSKLFSPVFRSPHRLPYSPHGMLSPQAQSPLCSVPEGGKIFNFNVPSPRDGALSDSDLISPSPLSPHIFTFPPQSTIHSPMSEVNRLALSPRAPYTPPPSFMRGKFIGAGGLPSPKWADDHSFYSKRSLSESDMTYLCPVCGQAFPSNDSLAKHMAKHLPTETVRLGDNKLHFCKVCNRSFSRSDMLTRHMRLHTGMKPYECMDCGQVFSRSDHLNTHRRTHTGEKPYRCPHCPYAACRRDMITRHMRTHAKRTPRRGRYLSVPEDGDAHKPSGSISSIETTDSQDCSTGGHTCSVSSVDSVENESLRSSHLSYLGANVDNLLLPDTDRLSTAPRPSPARPRLSGLSEEGMDRGKCQEGSSDYDRFMRYRKGRNWSTTSLESVDSEDAVLLREVLVDDAFQDNDPLSCVPGKLESNDEEPRGVAALGPGYIRQETNSLESCSVSSPHC